MHPIYPLLLSIALIVLAYYRDPCEPTPRLANTVAMDATRTALIVYHACQFGGPHLSSYIGPERVPADGTLFVIGLAAGVVHSADTFFRRGDSIRETLPRGCVCRDDDGEVIARGGGLRRGDKGYAEMCEGGEEGKAEIDEEL